MNISRKNVLLAAAALTIAAAFFFRPDGLITLNFTDAPVGKVIASIERQGHVKIATNVPPETTVTIQMKRVALMDALETLSVRVEGDLRVVFTGAPTKARAFSALAELASGQRPESWAVAWVPAMGMFAGDVPPDPRKMVVNPEPETELQSALRQVAIKSGIMTAVPNDWNPAAKMPSKPDTAESLVRKLITSSGGKVQQSFLILASGGRPPPPDGGPRQAGNEPPAGAPPQGQRWSRDRGQINPEWLAQRAEAAIQQLPKEEQVEAKADFDAMRKFWEEVRALPETERRAKMEEFFSRPDVQDKMEERRAARDARRTPEQREQRMKSYVERKKAIRSQTQQ